MWFLIILLETPGWDLKLSLSLLVVLDHFVTLAHDQRVQVVVA